MEKEVAPIALKPGARTQLVSQYAPLYDQWVVGEFAALDDLDIPEERRERARENHSSGVILQEMGRFKTKEQADVFVRKMLASAPRGDNA